MITLSEIQDLRQDALKNEPLGIPLLDELYEEDPLCLYYRFMYRLAQQLQPKISVELGVCTLRGTAHLAAGCPESIVYGIDPLPYDRPNIHEAYPNIKLLVGRSDDPSILAQVPNDSVGLCLVDSLHKSSYVLKECNLWTCKMANGGVFLFDDLELDADMAKVFLALPFREKAILPGLHHKGFGCAIVRK